MAASVKSSRQASTFRLVEPALRTELHPRTVDSWELASFVRACAEQDELQVAAGLNLGQRQGVGGLGQGRGCQDAKNGDRHVLLDHITLGVCHEAPPTVHYEGSPNEQHSFELLRLHPSKLLGPSLAWLLTRTPTSSPCRAHRCTQTSS